MARVRSRGYDPVLCLAPARRRPDQVNAAEDYRRRRRVAFFGRCQTRVEGVSPKRRFPMPIIQTRRWFINSIALAGGAGPRHVPRGGGAGGGPATNTPPAVKD